MNFLSQVIVFVRFWMKYDKCQDCMSNGFLYIYLETLGKVNEDRTWSLNNFVKKNAAIASGVPGAGLEPVRS